LHFSNRHRYFKCNFFIKEFSTNNWFIENDDKYSELESKIVKVSPLTVKFNQLFKDIDGFNKVLLIGENDEAKKAYDILQNGNFKDLNINMSKPNYIEIMNKNASKTRAIKELLNIYKIDKSEIIAIGDNYNDIDMIEFAGMGISMGNAPEEVKNISNDITASNDEGGVEKAIKKYF
jgi:Cof subfamily protein (haloacid dehalogenase superfamily)